MSVEAQLGKMKRLWRWLAAMAVERCQCAACHQAAHLQGVCFKLCIVYHNKNHAKSVFRKNFLRKSHPAEKNLGPGVRPALRLHTSHI